MITSPATWLAMCWRRLRSVGVSFMLLIETVNGSGKARWLRPKGSPAQSQRVRVPATFVALVGKPPASPELTALAGTETQRFSLRFVSSCALRRI